MQLCQNRPEGFGPKSSISSPVPTSCFVDTILLPLPTWIALLMLPVLAFSSMHTRRAKSDSSIYDLRKQWTSTSRNCGYRIATSIYFILIIANILMQVLEIVRLEILKSGFGLQPFVFVGLILGAVLHGLKGAGIRGWILVNSVIWVGGMVMNVIQAAGLAMESKHARHGGKYPLSDQVLDVAVMAGVYGIIMILEVILAVWGNKTCEIESVKSTERRDTSETLTNL